ncbi:MAG: CPBP family intramembrane metalloprotease domain-containing protein, partial [Planctomycetes bacterium]|nr:CPBP family intramembrane metalloprotease domain-containing protein [Planctomycetota bacterium]
MKWRNVFLIFHREVLDQLRDRRTLFMVAVLPLLLYPAMGIGTVQMSVLFSEQPRTVVILGYRELPSLPLVVGDRFARTWFRNSVDADKLRVITDVDATDDKLTQAEKDHRKSIVKKAAQLDELLQKRKQLERERTEARKAKRYDVAVQIDNDLIHVNELMGSVLSSSGIQVLMMIPEGFRENLNRLRQELAARGTDKVTTTAFQFTRPTIIQNSADEKSVIAHSRVVDVVDEWERALLREYLRDSGLPEELPTPVKPMELDLAEKGQVAANVWS